MPIRTMGLWLAATLAVLLVLGAWLILVTKPGLLARPPAGNAANAALAPNPMEEMTFVKVWTVAGNWRAVACDSSSGEIYALDFTGLVARLDRTGKELGHFRIQSSSNEYSSMMRLAHLSGGTSPDVVTFSGWGRAVYAHDATGKSLWTYGVGMGVDDVWIADGLLGEAQRRDRVIVGYNGGTGVHLLNGDGTVFWKNTTIGNVWHVCAGPTGPAGQHEIVTTAADGQIHFFDPATNLSRSLPAGTYSHLVRVWDPGAGQTPTIITSDSGSGQMVAIAPSGSRLWATSVPSGTSGHLQDGACSNSRPWFAAVGREGVTVYDVRSGTCLASANLGAMEVAWTNGTGDLPPRLVVAGSSLIAYELRPKTVPATPSSKEP